MTLLKLMVSISLLAIVTVLVGSRYGFDSVLQNFRHLTFATAGVMVVGLLANAVLASLRFKIIASGIGHPTSFRRAMAAVGAGSLAGAIFFQIAGQLIARGVVMKRGGMPFEAVVVVTLYERIVAAFVSALIAVIGAFYVFGKVYLDLGAGGAELVKIACGLILAISCAAWLGFGSSAVRNIKPLLTRESVLRLLWLVGLTLVVQLPMMIVYVVVAHEFSPATSIPDLVAASAIVMFSASIPISLAGWGVRELSAVVVLGAIGVAASDALTAALIIGAGSMLSMALIMIVSWQASEPARPEIATNNVQLVDYTLALAWVLPLMAAVFVLFQIYVPIGSGLLNVNLADPIAILAGSLFIINAIKNRQLPQWRVSYVNAAVALMTLALTGSLLLGASRFGWTDWALINRYLGWFVLLAYVATGALITSEGGKYAFRIFVLTYVGASVGVMILETISIYLFVFGAPTSVTRVRPGDVQGFAQNHNFLAFQLLMVAAGALVVLRNARMRTLLWTLLLVTFWFAGSRSGWIAIACIIVTARYLGVANTREIIVGLAGATAIAMVAAVLPNFDHIMSMLGINISIEGLPFVGAEVQVIPSGTSTAERIVTLIGGWELFIEHPIVGAGLGAYRNLMVMGQSGIPLVIHNSALWLLAELGLVGFLVFAVPGIHVWFTEWRRAAQERASAVVALCFVGFVVMSGPADMVYQRTFWLMIGAALAVPRLKFRKNTAV